MPRVDVWSAEMAFAPGVLGPPQARAVASQQLRKHRLDSLRDGAEIFVSELVVHADTRFTEGIEQRPRCVKLAVRDSLRTLPAPRDAATNDTGGRVEAYFTDWETSCIAGGQKLVWAWFATRAESSGED